MSALHRKSAGSDQRSQRSGASERSPLLEPVTHALLIYDATMSPTVGKLADDARTDGEILEELNSEGDTGQVETNLRADGRVLARVTDGIYRQPSAAFRELIANAYDADATRVVIQTDRPRFEKISVEDDGHGMSPAALIHLIRHIGGSTKRTDNGEDLGVTSRDDPYRSPGGRVLIGKIGIGLFSVAQLTRRFQVITKVEGDSWRTVADVNLRQFGDGPSKSSEATFNAGLVKIWKEPAPDESSHGTSIVLTNLRRSSLETLRSSGDWARVESDGATPPRFNIGFRPVKGSDSADDPNPYSRTLPWDVQDDPTMAFRKLVASVVEMKGAASPKLETTLDYYLRMVWHISLAVPLPYIDGGPFGSDLGSTSVFALPGPVPSRAESIDLADGETIAQREGWVVDPARVGEDFNVFFDDLKLYRPLTFTELPSTTHQIREPLLFFGGLDERFPGVPEELSGGPLRFKAYLLWAPKIVPAEHIGVLVRVAGASGTGFDDRFMRFSTSENTRMRQLTCEIFVEEGFDATLNIDRESFNQAHPHAVRLATWLHNAMTRAFSEQKQIASRTRKRARTETKALAEHQTDTIVASVWESEGGSASDVPSIEFSSESKEGLPKQTSTPDADLIFVDPHVALSSTKNSAEVLNRERKLKAILQILAAYDVLGELSESQRRRLVTSIAAVLEIGG